MRGLQEGDLICGYAVDLCYGCGYMLRCPRCDMNSCSGGYGEMEDGSDCPECPRVHKVYHSYRETFRRMYWRDSERIDHERKQHRAKLVAEGFPFATIEDLRNI